MGPIEMELRARVHNEVDMIFCSSSEAFKCWWDAWVSLGRPGGHCQFEEFFGDIASEAIEAAESLGI